jgi:hypothetical protein
MAKKARNNTIDNDQWLGEHFEEIIDKYSGKYPYVFVSKGKAFPVKLGDNIAEIETRITRRYGRPLGMPLPKPEDFLAILPAAE